jgi:hypothetical protein
MPLKTKNVTSKRVVVARGRSEVLNKDGWLVTVMLNNHPTVSVFFGDEVSARQRADALERRKIPKGAQLALMGGRWLPMTSCGAIFK